MPVTSFDVARVRGLYPTLGASSAHLDGPFSTLSPESVNRAIIGALRVTPAQPGSRSPRSQRGATSAAQARAAVADLVGGRADSVVLGTNQASMLLWFASLLAREWQLGDDIVVTRMDADVARMPWTRAARATGTSVSWAEVDLESGELPAWQFERLITSHTRLVTVPLTNPATGTVPDVATIAAMAHDRGALVVVDASSAIPYLPIDLATLGADLITLSATTFGGPTVAAAVARPGLLGEIDRTGRGPLPQRLELGPLPIELLDGVTAAVEHLAGLSEDAAGSRRERLVTSLSEAADYQRYLYEYVDDQLRAVPGVTVLGSERDRLPLLAFTMSGLDPSRVGEHLLRSGVSVWTGPSGITELMTAIGTDEMGGASFIGLMPHTTVAELDLLINALEALARM
jgi:cysteine desulfurase family protein (TIGR01976 family)